MKQLAYTLTSKVRFFAHISKRGSFPEWECEKKLLVVDGKVSSGRYYYPLMPEDISFMIERLSYEA